ncbi:hypothetical protein M440DRAFT_1225242 [Trichoderma longibrachiatum ATCC 18648]|uniref:Uncharacterized protein n=1 Tax=Trichoderma longibrachiatum ATCC 18648 TaxID=983965 RepID=A0A2T4C8H0_TRILO|nr:hypothetical protein M440DRAFT_1225242 [Trichoderma longibrachiatum ATCC 18648]
MLVLMSKPPRIRQAQDYRDKKRQQPLKTASILKSNRSHLFPLGRHHTCISTFCPSHQNHSLHKRLVLPRATTNQEFQQSSPSITPSPSKRYNIASLPSISRLFISSHVITHCELKPRSSQQTSSPSFTNQVIISVCVSVPFSRERCASSALVLCNV